MGFHNLMKLLSSLFTHGSRHFSNFDLLENGLKTADQKSLWILGLMTPWPCLSKSTLKPNVARCMESVENSTFRTSFSIQMEKWQRLGSDSSIPQSHQTMTSSEIWLRQDKLLTNLRINWSKTWELMMKMTWMLKLELCLPTHCFMSITINTHTLKEFCLKTLF